MRNPDWLRSTLDALFPRECHACGTLLGPDERFVCASCLARFPRTRYHRQPDNAMERRFMGLFPFERATGLFFYSRDSEISGLIHDFKYRGFPGLARMMGRVMARELLPAGFFDGIDVIQPVPLHWLRQATRGYNQSRELALGLSSETGLPVVDAVKAVRHHRTQTSLTSEARRRNLRGIFRVTDPQALAGRGVLLLDDVCTTGTTLAELARAVHDSVAGVRIVMLTLGVTF